MKDYSYLKEKGHLVDAKISSVLGININPKWKLTCYQYKDSVMHYYDVLLNYNPTPLFELKKIETLPVYVNLDNPKEYYIDTSIIEQFIGNQESL